MAGKLTNFHPWWAARPFAACRAIVFASLVPDPDDPLCPPAFREKVTELLKGKQYEPYRDIPYTAEEDNIADTPRNRLLAFIGKYSDTATQYLLHGGKAVPPKDLLSTGSLVKWESSIDQDTLRIARTLLALANSDVAPAVLDLFAGRGAIPLEAARLGCESWANELNPVAHLIEIAALQLPQKYGSAATFTPPEYTRLYGRLPDARLEENIHVPNRLVHDVQTWAQWVLDETRAAIGHLYPTRDGKPVVAYYWVRTVRCSNPACNVEVPLLRSLWLCQKPQKRVAIRLIVDKPTKAITYEVASDKAIDFDASKGPNIGGNLRCPICAEVTPAKEVRAAAKRGEMHEQLLAVIVDGPRGKEYRIADAEDVSAFEGARKYHPEQPGEQILPEINAESAADGVQNSSGIRVHLYGMRTWGSLFNVRQLVSMQTLVKYVRNARDEMLNRGWSPDYANAVTSYLGLWIDRVAAMSTSVGRWHTGRELMTTPFSRQAIAMVWDYPEVNLLSEGTGGAALQLATMLEYVRREATVPTQAHCVLGSATSLPELASRRFDAVITDPPYYDAISYADLSDFFYVWLKRALSDVFPSVFRTPLTPKSDECTSLKHRFASESSAREHFETMLTASFSEARRVVKDDGVVTIMFAHQSTDAWTAFVNAILDAGLTITASWPIDTEMKTKVGAVGSSGASYLASSVTVVCRKREANAVAAFGEIRNDLQKTIAASLDRVWKLGFRGADLIVSTFGPAVGVFGQYERVEKADGTNVTVPELLELVRDMAFKQIVQELPADSLTRAYVAWLNLYSTGTAPYDRAQKTIQMGTDANIADVADRHRLFMRDGGEVRAALAQDRAEIARLGEAKNAPVIDRVHRAMLFWKRQDRSGLIAFMHMTGCYADDAFWRTLQALREVLPGGSEDAKLGLALLAERESLSAAVKQKATSTPSFL